MPAAGVTLAILAMQEKSSTFVPRRNSLEVKDIL